MKQMYVIRWKSKVNGRTGRGTKLFKKEEAELLAEELNREYPQIEHSVGECAVEQRAPEPQTPAESPDSAPEANPGPILAMA